MADETPSLHIDTDWKKQAQEEKRKLAEQEAAKKAQAAAPPAAPAVGPAAAPSGAGPAAVPGRGRQAREMPVASISTLIQSLMTQALYYMGELGGVGGEMLNLDMARHQIDTLSALESKTKGNLEPAEQKLLDTALYETRNRFVSVASQLI